MIKKLEYGKSYAIYLNSLYGGYKSNVRIIGKTNIDNVVSNNADDYNIYKTYFEPVGLGLTSYYSAIKPETTIYIGLVVDSLEPYSYTEEKVFIPESLIDFDKSEEYIKVSKISFNIYPIVRKFSTEIDRDEFIAKTKTELLNRVKSLIEFSNLDTEVESDYSDLYITKEEYDVIDTARESVYKSFRKRMIELDNAARIKEANYNTKLAELDSKIKEYEKARQEMENTKNRYQGMIDMLEN